MKFILGKKIGMSRVFDNEKTIPVTLIEAGPCFITQIKTEEKDGYNAVQVGYGRTTKKNKAKAGHLKKAGKDIENIRYSIEFKVDNIKDYKLGQKIDIDIFEKDELLTLTGYSKGRGFTGVVKRHGFAGAPKTHGHRHDERSPGSIGAAFPEHVFKGIRMAGRSGNEKNTFKNLKVIMVDKEKNVMAVKGSVPGHRNSLVIISSIGK